MSFQIFQVNVLPWNTKSLTPRPTESKPRFIQSPFFFSLLSDKKSRLSSSKESSNAHPASLFCCCDGKGTRQFVQNDYWLSPIKFHHSFSCWIHLQYYLKLAQILWSQMFQQDRFLQCVLPRLTDKAKALIAFPTHLRLMELCHVPFGLSTACGTYICFMRIVFAGL